MIQILKDTQQLSIDGRLYKDNLANFRTLAAYMPHGPVTRHYEFHSKYSAPMPHQVATVDFMCRHNRGFVFNSIGTGKTLCMDWLYDYLRREGVVQRCLIIAPLSTLRSVHAEELKWSFPHLRYAIVHGSKKKRMSELAKNVDVYIMNFDGFLAKWATDPKSRKLSPSHAEILNILAYRPDINCVFIDEIAIMRNCNTNSWRSINYLFGQHRSDVVVYGFTGSPMPKSPTDAYAQVKLISPHKLPQQYDHRTKKTRPVSYTKFASLVTRPKGDWGWEPLKGWEKTCYGVLQPSIRFTREQVEPDLPPVTLQTHEVPLTSEQKKAYNQMVKEFRVELRSGHVISAVHEGAKLLKLNQIACGAIYGEDQEAHHLSCKNRLEELIRIKQQLSNHLLVSVPFKNIVRYLFTELSKLFKVGVITGSTTSEKQRAELIHQFNYKDLDVLIATPGSIPHGVNLQHNCNTTVWWGPINRYDHYEQFNGRTDRKGQKNKVLLIHYESAPVQRDMYRKLKHKESAQGILLQLLEETV